jgi:hypothetical protein
MNKWKLIFVVAVAIPALIFLASRIFGYEEYTKSDRARMEINAVAGAANDSLAELQSWRAKTGGSLVDGLIVLKLARASALVDPWGERLLIRCADEKCSYISVRSFGPNHVDDGGGGDDIVSRK